MTAARHKAVVESSGRRRVPRVVVPILAATLVTSSAVGFALVGDVEAPPSQYAGAVASAEVSASTVSREPVHRPDPQLEREGQERLADRTQRVSRSAKRVTIEEKPVAVGHRFSTVALNIRKGPSQDAPTLTTVDPATKIPVTGVTDGDWSEVVWDEQAFWVATEYLAKKKPELGVVSIGGFSTAPCASGSEIESGITANAVRVFRAVCAEFPQITSYGGWRGDGEHSDGRAIDIMVSGDLGWQVADYLRANAGAFGLYDIIYSQRIWTAQRSAEGWRAMEDRGSVTANHYDHVHVKVF